MKKLLFLLFCFIVSILTIGTAMAQTQTQKIGFFDIDMMTQAMPGYKDVDSMMVVYERDDLAAEYEFATKEYTRLDSTYKADSAAKKSAVILNKLSEQRTQTGMTLVYWQQLAQNKSQQKRQEYAAPLYSQVLTAYKKVLATNNYAIVLKPSAIELLGSTKVENVFEKVAKELKIPLPEGLKVQR